MLPLCSGPISSTVLLTASTCNAVKNDYIFIQSWLVRFMGERFFCVGMYVCGITKSAQMWCKLTSSNVACCGLVWQTSLTSLHMENSLCVYYISRADPTLSFVWFLSSSLSVVMNKITLVTDWPNQESIGEAYFGLALASWIGGLGVSPHLWPFRMLTFPSGYTAKWALPKQQGGGCTQLAQVYFWSEEDVWVGRKCAQLFFLY